MNYPTVDINVASQFAPNDLSNLSSLFDDRIAPLLYKAYGIPPRNIRGHDIFVIKYDAALPSGDGSKQQRGLRRHTDGGYLSVNVALNEGYEGGGTTFFDRRKCDLVDDGSLLCDDESSKMFVKLRTGEAVAHCAKVLHEGREITAGVRYILVFFLQIDKRSSSPDGEVYSWWGWLKDLNYLDSHFSALFKATKQAVSLQSWNDGEAEITRRVRNFKLLFFEKASLVARAFADLHGDFSLYAIDISGGAPPELGKANWFEGQRWELNEWGKLVPRSEGAMERSRGVSSRNEKV